MNEEKRSLLALSLVQGVGSKSIKNLISYLGSASEVLQQTEAQLLKIPGIGKDIATRLSKYAPYEQADEIINNCQKKGIQIFCYTEKAYPYKLKQIYDAPPVLFVKGKGEIQHARQVAIVGTRNASEYGKEMAKQLVESLKQYRVQIISGLAYGIDIHAHQAAINQQVPTWAVLASGLDIIYPAIHKKAAMEIQAQGGLISEQAPGTKPDAFFFPARNRIIAGMSDITIVVEAAEKGGALITANLANDYDREVGAVPGRTSDTYSAGCLKLIQANKAHLINSGEDIAQLLNWDVLDEKAAKRSSMALWDQLPEQEAAIMHLLLEFKEGIAIDTISWKTQIPINRTASLLLNLEFMGLVKALPGKKFKMVG